MSEREKLIDLAVRWHVRQWWPMGGARSLLLSVGGGGAAQSHSFVTLSILNKFLALSRAQS